MPVLALPSDGVGLIFLLASICALVLFVSARYQPVLARAAAARRGALGFLRSADSVFLLLIACYVSVFLTLVLRQHASYNTGFDLAVFDNQVWSITAGHLLNYPLINSVDFKDYSFDPLITMLVPLYAIIPDARTLLIAATFALASAAIPIYWYAKNQVGWLIALAVSFSFFISPAIQYVNLLNFHVIVLATPLLALALFFLFRKRYIPFLVCAFLAMLAKEEVALIVLGFGIFLFIVQRRFWAGLALGVFGFLSLLFVLNYVFPSILGQPYFHSEGRSAFSYYGKGVWQVLTSFVTRPEMIWNTISSAGKTEYLAALFLPLGLVPLLGLEYLLTSFPFLMALILTNPNYAQIELQYSAALLPSVYFALILGLKRLRTGIRNISNGWAEGKSRSIDIALATCLLLASLVGYVIIAPGPLSLHFDAARFQVSPTTGSDEAVFSQISPGAVVVAQEELLPHFSNRNSIYVFPSMPDYRLADYMVAVRDRFFYNFHQSSWARLVSYGYFETAADDGSVILLRRKDAEKKTDIQFGSALQNIGYTLAPQERLMGGAIARPILYWKAAQSITQRLSIAAEIADLQGHVWAGEQREPLDGLLPTNQWKVGQLVADQFALVLPPTMPTGDYQLSISANPASDGDPLEAKSASGVPLGTSPVIATIHVDKDKESISASELKIERPLFADMNELRLLGTTAFDDRINPGDVIPIGIYWRARVQPSHDYTVSVQLRNANGNLVAEQKDRPAMGTYKTTELNAGEVLLDWHDLAIPSSIPNGDYTIYVTLGDDATSLPAGEIAVGNVRAPK